MTTSTKAPKTRPELVGGVGAVLEHDHHGRAHRSLHGLPGLRADDVGYLQISRGLRGDRLDVVLVDEAQLARLVADGAGILARLAKERRSTR